MEYGCASRVVRFDGDLQTIDEFLAQWKPSSLTTNIVEWLTVTTHCAEKMDAIVDTPGLLCAWESLCASSRERLTTKDIEHLAIAHNVLEGKWMIFVDQDKVDAEWGKVARGVVKGSLALDAKVSTCHVKLKKNGQPKEEKIPPGQHVICVWSPDFTQTEDIFDLRARLRELGFDHSLFYKPDAYSVCGVYQGNSLGLSPVKWSA